MLGFDPSIHGATPSAFAAIDVTVPLLLRHRMALPERMFTSLQNNSSVRAYVAP